MRFATIALLFAASTASAEPRHTTEAVTVRKKPGEKQAAAGSLPAGTPVEVVGEDGRWLLVRAGSVKGYVVRTAISAASREPVAARAWSAARPSRELYVTAVREARLLAGPRSGAALGEIAKGARLAVVDAATHPAWLHVRAGDREGWIARVDVDDGTGATALAPSEPRRDEVDDFRRATPRRALRADVGIGYRTLGMDLTSNSNGGGLANYLIDADAVALVADVDAIARGGRWFVALDARPQLGRSQPGIDYPGPTAPPGKIPFALFAIDAGARAGVRARGAIDVAVRAGVHYDAFLVDDVDNAGTLPRERLLGVTAGVRADIAQPHSRFAITARLDVLGVGSRAQTRGLEDGTASTSRAVWAGLAIRYALGARWSVLGGYDFGRAVTEWTGMSVREPGATSTRRIDGSQLVQLGISSQL